MTLHFLPPSLAVALFWIAALVCAGSHVAIFRSVLRAKRRRAIEIAWAVLPAVALAVVFLMTWRTMHASVI